MLITLSSDLSQNGHVLGRQCLHIHNAMTVIVTQIQIIPLFLLFPVIFHE